jgi:hypothetical protein
MCVEMTGWGIPSHTHYPRGWNIGESYDVYIFCLVNYCFLLSYCQDIQQIQRKPENFTHDKDTLQTHPSGVNKAQWCNEGRGTEGYHPFPPLINLQWGGCQMHNTSEIMVLTAVSVPIRFFWVKSPCRLVGRCRRFGQACCLHLEGWSDGPNSEGPYICSSRRGSPDWPLPSELPYRNPVHMVTVSSVTSALKIVAARFSETLSYTNQSTRRLNSKNILFASLALNSESWTRWNEILVTQLCVFPT